MKKIILSGLMLLLLGCGQKGPLYIPEQAPTNQEESENKDEQQERAGEVINGSF